MTASSTQPTYTRTTDHLKDGSGFVPDGMGEYQFCGTQWDVAAHVPGVFRAMSPLSQDATLPTAPRPLRVYGTDRGYWFPLFALMLSSLGWVRPDAGLNWWYGAGKPTDDPRLALIHDVWYADGALQSLTCELWRYEGFWAFGKLGDHAHFTPLGYRQDRIVDRGQIAGELTEELARTPRPGSSDPLHMALHLGTYANNPTKANARLVATDPHRGRAMLLTDHMDGWYADLARLGNDLGTPALPGRMSWHVDVVVEHVGWLGTYRRSAETGLWFAGRHQLHTREPDPPLRLPA